MWQEVFNMALNNGLWAVLFLCLLVYVLKDSKKREIKYKLTIDALIDRLGVVEAVKEDTGVLRRFAEEGV